MQGPYQDRELVLQVLDTDDGPYDDRVGEVTNTGGPRKSLWSNLQPIKPESQNLLYPGLAKSKS